jgi:hypothetical protein
VSALAGCGGGGSSSKTHAPTNADLIKLSVLTDIPAQCLSSSPDQAKLQSDVDALIEEYRAMGPDRSFKMVPTGSPVTMRKLMTQSRDALQACAQAQRGGSAAQSLVDRINAELDKG